MENIKNLIEIQRAFALSRKALRPEFRIEQLTKLKSVLKQNEELLSRALFEDVGKSAHETYMTELALVYHEINDAIKNLAKWSRPKRIFTNIANLPGQSRIIPEPYGSVLIIGAWNYPLQLTLAPLVASMAAGNVNILKPSELTPKTSEALHSVINKNFDEAYLHVICGGVSETEALLSEKFDKIFFTGSTSVGKIVAKAAAVHLTPITLELGGKSPCIVFNDADIKLSAKRIAWGKVLNAGQTCIAPDYILVEKNVYEDFLKELKAQMNLIVGTDYKNSSSYMKIVNEKHIERLKNLISPEKIYSGGEVDAIQRFISPTILRDVTFSDKIMEDEIFGPIAPVIPFENLDDVIREIKSRPKPLSFYAFTKNVSVQEKLLEQISFGGGCINDVLMHISNPKLPFGGVGSSGTGSYHSEAGFKTFSHMKSILKKPFWLELPIKYAPYSDLKMKILRFLFD